MRNTCRFLALALAALLLAAGAMAQTYSVLYTFTGTTDGSDPQPGLIHDAAGNLYGATNAGGVPGCSGCGFGVVFQLDPAGNLTVLHTFTGQADGANPHAGVVRDMAGNLYGTATAGGANKHGVVFKLDSSGNFTLLHSFTGGADGSSPYGGVVRDSSGNLYGTARQGGNGGCPGNGCGTIFKVDAAGNFTVLHSFTGADGGQPTAGLIRDSSGNLYGTTGAGGSSGSGTVFKLDLAGNLTVLHTFTGADGAQPFAGVIRDPAGNLYGTTHAGGATCFTGFGCGVVFKLDPAGNFTVLHSFTGGADGALPGSGSLSHDSAWNLYGAVPSGGASNAGGVAFKLDAAGNFTVLHTFTSSKNGLFPNGLLSWAGSLYGTTSDLGPNNGRGVIFKLP